MSNQKYRQVHLDFHTSEFIPDVARQFDKHEFAKTLKESYVDSITCFARCHHGWLYYPSESRPDLIHPQLQNKNLLLEQIEACHEQGIKVPIYTTVQWDGYIARKHPEWLSVDCEGNYLTTQEVPEPHFYYTICLNSDYRQYFKEHLVDMIQVIGEGKIDGFFFDILFEVDCHCNHCIKQMKARGYDVKQKGERMKYATVMLNEFKKEITTILHQQVPDAGVFYNGSHIGPKIKASLDDYTHLEIESLPSGGWGYDHFPSTVRYARKLGKDIIGMTGKFHTYWGDFHSLKNRAALEFECFHMFASGAGISIGDQLHPNGQLSTGSYKLIGSVFEKVAKMEPYCKEAVNLSEIAVLTPEEQMVEEGIVPSLIGTVRMLQELTYQFDIIDSKMDFNDYRLIILPDHIKYQKELEEKLKLYQKNGGKIIASYRSLAKEKKEEISLLGVKWYGDSPYDREFVLPNEQIGKQLYKEEYVMYSKGSFIKATQADVLMETVKPYFNREGKTFCSHQHAPSSKEMGHPAVTKLGNVIYFSHPIFHLYRQKAPMWCKHMLQDAIETLLDEKLIRHKGPSSLIVTMQRNHHQNIDAIHLLHFITEKKSVDLYTIEDRIPLYNVMINVWVDDKKACNVTSISTGDEIPFTQEGSYIQIKLDKLDGHEMCVIEYRNEV
ncbi:Beta-galactosidase trimerisation domain-containing protein [Gracilibacillus orientalis]|uniref:Beta-galactosidase trimerisation domain-containing protein n=1 Tax=Gracilibacillus orientalis TaxID=334253 RepID=A0A1I4JR09_9BACI|nr:alpha-amylase family protein [Gracilibacillus orientalis]SFL68989.1 Beta-galactosidase trimerisation domain-containing protein [Gracilibacillus orientalis]